MRLTNRFLAPSVLLLAMLLPAGSAIADPAIVERAEQTSEVVSNCNGEIFQVRGTVHIVTKEQKDGSFLNNGTFRGTVTSDSGTEYILNVVAKGRGESVDDVSFEQRSLLISKGSAPNELITARFSPETGGSIEFECRG